MRRSNDNNVATNVGMYIFECVMSVLYLAIAYTLLLTNIFKESLPKEIRIALGVLFIIYGVYRIIRAIRKGLKMNEMKKEE